MLAVTDAARDVLGEIVTGGNVPEERTLRLTRGESEEFGLSVDEERPGDQVVSQGDQPLLLIESELADQLTGVVLDVAETAEGIGLRLVQSDIAPSRDGASPG
ncbi:MAG: hypothetical protein AB7L91_03965 [Dehalococcoidia bacterium]